MTGSPASTAITIPLAFDITAIDWTDNGAHIVAAGINAGPNITTTYRLAMVDATTGTTAWQVADLSDWCVYLKVVGALAVLMLGSDRSEESVIAVHDVASGAQVWRRDDLRAQVAGVDPGGRWVAAAGPGVLVLDITNGQQIAQSNLAVDPVDVPYFWTADSNSTAEQLAVQAVAATNPATWEVAIVSASTGAVAYTVPTATQAITVAFDDDGATLTIAEAGQVTVVDGASGTQITRCALEGAPSSLAALSPDRRIVAMADSYKMAMYVVSTGQRLGAVTWGQGSGLGTWAFPAAFSPDARSVVVTRTISGSGPPGAELVTAPVPHLLSGLGATEVMTAAFSPAGDRLAVARKSSPEGTGLIDVIATGPLADIAQGSAQTPVQVLGVDVTGAGMKLVAGVFSDGYARLYAAEGGAMQYERGKYGALTDVVFAGGGDGLVIASTDGGVRMFSTATGRPGWAVQHGGPVNALACSPAGDLVCSASSDKTVRCIDVASGTERWRTTLPQGVIRLAVSPDASFVVAATSVEKATHVLELANGTERWRMPDTAAILGLAVSPDHALVATAGEDGLVTVRASDRGSPQGTVSHRMPATSAVFTADSKNIISGSQYGTVLMNSVADLSAPDVPPLASYHPVAVTELAANGTDPSVAVVTGDQMVRVLDLDLRAELARFRHDAAVTGIAADPVSRLLATGTSDGTIRVYPWPAK